MKSLAVNLNISIASALDVSDVLRSAIVAAVSGFDAFVHDLSRIGMLEVYTGARRVTNSFKNFKISIDCIPLAALGRGAAAEAPNHAWFGNEIRKQHGWQSFQQPDKVADAFRLFSECDLWREVALILRSSPESIRKQLSLIVDRRNKIAHEADSDPTAPGARWPIDEKVVQESIDFLEKIGAAILKVAERR